MARPPGCDPGCACRAGNEFGEAEARSALAKYRRSGPPKTTSWLIDGLRDGGIDGLTVLDIGAGVGAVYQELLASGASAATDVEGSPAYLAAAREEAERRGTTDRIRFVVGDFVLLRSEIETADLVVLDRVICCYSDMEALVRASVTKARHRYGLVYPRDPWWARRGASILNGFFRLTRQRVRMYIHPTQAVDAIVRAAGFRPTLQRTNLFWQVAVYERAA